MTRRVVQGALLAGCALAVPASARAGGSPALWSQAQTSVPGSFAGGTFSPSVAPTVTQKYRGVNDLLGWSAVSFSGSATVTYMVMRTDPSGTVTQVCTGADAPVVSSGTVTCTDRRAPKSSLYSEQPVILNGGSVTWSLAPSAPG